MTRTYTEMIHGDMLWQKQQETALRMHRLGKTEAVMIDAEAGYTYRYEYQYHVATERALVDALTMGMGFGKGIQAKRKMVADRKVVAEINGRHPALAAEQRVGGTRAERSIALEMQRLREWKKLNWAIWYGMAGQRKVK